MLSIFINALTKGDLAGLKSKLLHSTSWAQHNAKAYGADKLQAFPMNWLKLASPCSTEHSTVICQNKHQVIDLNLTPKGAENSVNYTFWLETNGEVIKSVDAILDTVQLALATNQSCKSIQLALPQPDAFVLQDYDQQDSVYSTCLSTIQFITTLNLSIAE